MSVLQESQIKAYCSFPVCLLPDGTDEIFLATADGGNHFLDFGIHEGMELIFDAKKGFTEVNRLASSIKRHTKSSCCFTRRKDTNMQGN